MGSDTYLPQTRTTTKRGTVQVREERGGRKGYLSAPEKIGQSLLKIRHNQAEIGHMFVKVVHKMFKICVKFEL